MSEYTAYFNGDWVPNSEVKIDPLDRGFMVGDVVFDVERTFNGKSFRMREHIQRLYRSLKYVRIDPGLTADEMIEISEEAIRRNEMRREPGGDVNIRQVVTRGPGRHTWDAGPPTVLVRVNPIDFDRYSQFYSTGVHGVVTRTRSYEPEALDPKVKHYSRMNFNLAELEANDRDPGAWPILRDSDGNLTEGSGYNVFLVTDGVIRTPTDTAILQGVSRTTVLDLSEQLGIPVMQENLQPYDAYTADEVFFASTSFCVLPVTQIDQRGINDRTVGPVVKQLLAAWSELVGVDIVDQALQGSDKLRV